MGKNASGEMKWSHLTATATGYYYKKKDKKRNGKHHNMHKENLKLYLLWSRRSNIVNSNVAQTGNIQRANVNHHAAI